MIPDWMKKSDDYVPVNDYNTFIKKTLESIGTAMSKIKIQRGHEKIHSLPAIFKLLILLLLIILTSVSNNKTIILTIAAVMELYLCTWPASDIIGILKPSFVGAILSLIILFPAMIMNPAGINNNIYVIVKVFLCVEMLGILNHTTQWNHITGALKKLHVPWVFIFTIDITLKYIVLLGNIINDLLVSLSLKSVGKNNRKYQSIGGILGITFIKSIEHSHKMYEAMQCRGFTDDYKGARDEADRIKKY